MDQRSLQKSEKYLSREDREAPCTYTLCASQSSDPWVGEKSVRIAEMRWCSRTLRAYKVPESPTRTSGTERRHVMERNEPNSVFCFPSRRANVDQGPTSFHAPS